MPAAAPRNRGHARRGPPPTGPTDPQDASQPGPPMLAIRTPRGPHSRRDASVTQSRQPVFQRTGEPGDDGVESPFSLDKFDDFVIEERSIGANSYFSDRFGQLGEGALQQRNRERRNVGVAGMVATLPTILRVPLEAQQRKVRAAPALLGVVAHLGSFLTAVDREHRA